MDTGRQQRPRLRIASRGNNSGVYDKHNGPQRDSIPGARELESGMLPLDQCDVQGVER